MKKINYEYNLRFCETKLIPLIKEAVDQCLKISYQIEEKGHGNFVTTVDQYIEQNLKEGLDRLIPEAGYIAEESGNHSVNGLNWVIDPIDGTTNFIYKLPYAVSVALTDQNVDQVILGVVYNPEEDILYYACRGAGSYIVQNGIKKQIRVGSFSANEGIAIFGMPYDRSKAEKIFEIAKKIYAISSDLKRIGPSSLDICRVAEGTAKLYFELDLNAWDICAGKLILTEAGGNFRQEGDLFLFGTDAV